MRKILRPLLLVFSVALVALLKYRLYDLLGIDDPSIASNISIFISILLWFSCYFLLNRFLKVFIWEGSKGEPVPKLLQEIASVILAVITVAMILAFVFKKSLTGLWATSGVISVVLGFALKGMLSDIFAGIAINMERPFRIGDWIEVHGRNKDLNVIGQVREINWRTTRLLSPQKNYIIISNTNLSMMTIINYSRPKNQCWFEIPVVLDFLIPIERSKRLLLSAAKLSSETKGFYTDPAPSVYISEISESGIVYNVRFWIMPWKGISVAAAKDMVYHNIIRNLHKAGISIVYPSRRNFTAGDSPDNMDIDIKDDRKNLLSKVKLFSNLNDAELDILAESSQPEYYDEGELIIQKGEEGDSVIILFEGILDVFSYTENTKEEIKLAVLKSGDFFGEMSFFTGAPRSANVKAGTDVCLFKIHKEVMDKLLHNRPKIAEHISSVIAERSLQNSKKLENMSIEKQIAATDRLSNQVLQRIRSFFKIF